MHSVLLNKLNVLFLICQVLIKIETAHGFSECPNCGVADPNVPGVTNCISWLAYLQSVGQSAYAWCQDASNYQKCCISCQNYLQFGDCKDIAYAPECQSKASLGLCDLTLSDSIKLSSLCPKSCGRCQTPSLNCRSLVRNCNSGTCLTSYYFSVQSIQCSCPIGKGGSYCQLDNPCNANPCFNGGVCTPLYEDDKMYSCSCTNGYYGNRCEYNACSTRFCLNGGTCLVANGSPACICPPSFTGPSCQTFVGVCSSNPCQNGGTCSAVSTGYRCFCAIGYSGSNCQYQITTQTCARGDVNRTLCNSWSSLGFCDFKYLYESVPLPLYCPTSCNMCANILACIDTQTNCGIWSSLGLCELLKTSNPLVCRRSCNMC